MDYSRSFPVCAEYFTPHAATLVCNMQGLYGGTLTLQRLHPNSNDTMSWYHIKCRRDSFQLRHCEIFSNMTCDSSMTVYVTCGMNIVYNIHI